MERRFRGWGAERSPEDGPDAQCPENWIVDDRLNVDVRPFARRSQFWTPAFRTALLLPSNSLPYHVQALVAGEEEHVCLGEPLAENCDRRAPA
jgi:hypothetical protein